MLIVIWFHVQVPKALDIVEQLTRCCSKAKLCSQRADAVLDSFMEIRETIDANLVTNFQATLGTITFPPFTNRGVNGMEWF